MNMLKYFSLILLFLFCAPTELFSQKYTRQDSLKGSITKERAWWNLKHYDLQVEPDVDNKFLTGKNTISYEVLAPYQTLQIDLQAPMVLIKIEQDGKELVYRQEGAAYFVELESTQKVGEIKKLSVFFNGRPKEALNPPWDGGFVWSKDRNNKDFVANAVQGLGASSWFPCKDHPYDEPDQGIDLQIIVPQDLVAVGNGRLREKKKLSNGKILYTWKVTQPINGYGINMNLADYSYFNETYQGEKGELTCDYFVLSYNYDKAKEQFRQVPLMLEAFEYWFGPYPFYEDGYKLVEVPYLGMEHQSSVTYGNGYQNGYQGNDISFSGWGHKFDFIIIHESGHEWFANNITNSDVADMWIHEGFANYSEVLYLDYHFGTEAGNEYLIGLRQNIKNDVSLIGTYGVSQEGSSDMYAKGAALIHNLRQIINDDEKFRLILRGLNEDFYHQTVSSKQIEDYFIEKSGLDLQLVFDQYLRNTKIPWFQYKIKGETISFRYKKAVKGFHMPLRIKIDGEDHWIEPESEWKEYILDHPIKEVQVDQNFYIEVR